MGKPSIYERTSSYEVERLHPHFQLPMRCKERRAVVGFAAHPMRPFQVIGFVKSFKRAFFRGRDDPELLCTRMHLFVSKLDHFMTLHLQAFATPSLNEEDVFSISPEALVEMSSNGTFSSSLVVLEDYEAAKRSAPPAGKNRRVEVVRINAIRWWIRESFGRFYEKFLFVDTRDALFISDPVGRVEALISKASEAQQLPKEFIFAGLEEYPFFRYERVGIRWNVEVHCTVFHSDLMFEMQKIHLAGHPYYQLVNSGVYGGTYYALMDLFEIWGASTAAVVTETFGIDQPLLGALFYFGLRLTNYSHQAFLISVQTGPIRHLYPDGGESRERSNYPYMRFSNATPAVQLNCNDEPYALIHQGDRYKPSWDAMIEPYNRPSESWARRMRLPYTVWTWPTKKPRPAAKAKH
jgi:hypothetical protein